MPLEKTDPCPLDRCVLCRSCSPAWTGQIAASHQVFHYQKGQTIFSEGKELRGLYFIYCGAVKVHQSWGPGNEFILRFAVSGDVLGHRAQGSGAASPISATALERTTVCYLDNEFLETTIKANPSFVHSMMLLYAAELQNAEKRMRNLVHMSVKGRVSQALILLKNQFGINNNGHIGIELTRQDLASFSGAAYESLFRTINDLTDKNLISIAGKHITINNEARLLQMIEDESVS